MGGAIPPLVELLEFNVTKVRAAAGLALGTLAHDNIDISNQIHISQRGAIPQLIGMLKSPDVELRRMSVRTLRNLAQDLHNQASIAHNGGIEPLLSLLDSNNANLQYDAAFALYELVVNEDFAVDFIKVGGFQKLKDGHFIDKCTKMPVTSTLKMLGHQMKGQVLKQLIYLMRSEKKEMYLGEEYVNNGKLSDVTFLVEGRSFYARRDCLLSSDVFQAMFHGGYRESEAKHVVIPNIKWDVFETMMRFIYTGTADVNLDIAQDLLRAADQFLLDNLKLICEYAIALDISEENVLLTYEMSEAYNATTLKHECLLFVLKRFDKLRLKPWYCPLVHRMVPEIRMLFSTLLSAADPSLYLSPCGGNELWIGISCKNYDGNHGDIIE